MSRDPIALAHIAERGIYDTGGVCTIAPVHMFAERDLYDTVGSV